MEETLGKRIVFHRKRLALTQDALAELMGVTAQAVSKWENDQSCPDIGALPKLAEIFGVSVDLLLGGGAAAPEDARAVRPLWDAARALLDGTLVLRAADGTERPLDEAELAVLLAALLGQTD